MSEEELKNFENIKDDKAEPDFSRFQPKNVVDGVIITDDHSKQVQNADLKPEQSESSEDVQNLGVPLSSQEDSGSSPYRTNCYYEDTRGIFSSNIENEILNQSNASYTDYNNNIHDNSETTNKQSGNRGRGKIIAVISTITICIVAICFLIVKLVGGLLNTHFYLNINGKTFGNDNGSYDYSSQDDSYDDFYDFDGKSDDFYGDDGFYDFHDFEEFEDFFNDQFGDFGFSFGDNTPYGYGFDDDGDYANPYFDEGNDSWPALDDYYEFHDELRQDLSYKVVKKHYENTVQEDGNTDSKLEYWIEYPEMEGGTAVAEKVNGVLREEIEIFDKTLSELGKNSNTQVQGYSYGYVTYMDEDVMSVIYEEAGSDGSNAVVYLRCFNFDMKTGELIDNHTLVEVNEQFAEEFKVKSTKQNGQVDSLDNMSNDDIMKYMNSNDLIAFYTPQGLEIGINYPEGWITVTYQDLSKYGEEL